MGDPAVNPDGRSWSVGWLTESWVFEWSESSVEGAFSLEVAADLDPEALDPSSGTVGCSLLACSLPLRMKYDDGI